MSEPLLQIGNRHVVDSGDPPIVNSDDPDVYIGYFENLYGEQWIFTFHRGTRKAELRGGDIGWNSIQTANDGVVDDLILNPEEAMWLRACWEAAAVEE
jgi:hypothetical protein